MSVVLKWSLVLVIAVTVLKLAVTGSGLHADPVAGAVLFLSFAILFDVGAVSLALRETAPTTAYGGQLLNALQRTP